MRSLLVLVAACASLAAANATAAEFKFDDRTFTVADEFIVERVAGPPLVDRPITCDFDELGRLYVADSSGSNDPVQKQLAERPHRVLRLEDTDGDGQFDKRTVFADKLMFPEGTMWFRGSLYVATPPSIWKLTDTDGDGVADKREEWFKGKTLTGCANDLHGPYRGRDGWIYWCKGAFAEQTYDLPDKKGWKTRAAHIFRARPDGTGIEPVMTGGMDNPVDVVFTPEGERIFSCTFLVHPGGGKRDGLIHAIYGGVYGKDHNVLDGHPRTGDLMPVMTHLGPAAPCGLHHIESTHLGDDWKGNLLCCQFNLRKVSRHKLIPDGATYKTEDSDFLTSDAMDFHPTDVIEDADGSILVCDTGGWYKLCCPTSQFHRPEALGAIYRVRRADAKKVDDPRGLKMNWAKMLPDELVLYLDDPRHTVRERAIETLAARPAEAYAFLRDVIREEATPQARVSAVWACCRIDKSWARSFIRDAIGDKSSLVRHAAIHAAGVWRDAEAEWPLTVVLASDSPPRVRAAAEAYGRLGAKAGEAAMERDLLLLSCLNRAEDRAIEHSVIFGAIESQAVDAAERMFDVGSPRARRAAIFVVEGAIGESLDAESMLPLLSSDEPIVRDAAWTIAERHAEWGDALAVLLDQQLGKVAERSDAAADLARRLAQFAANGGVRKVVLTAFQNEQSTDAARQTALAAMAQARVKHLPDDWFAALADSIDGRRFVAECVDVLRGQSMSKEQAAKAKELLVALGVDERQSVEIRLRAFEAIPGAIDELSAAEFDFLRARLGKNEATLARSSAVAILARSRLSGQQLSATAGAFAALGPFDIARLLPLYEQAADEKVIAEAVVALESASGAAQLSAAALRPFVDKLPPSLRPRGDKLLLRADASVAQQHEKLASLLAALQDNPGDVQRGRAIFHGKKAACAGCHAIAYVGGQVGPDLTRVGQIRSQRDLVEAIAFPSASFVRSFEPVLVVTTDGRQVNGLLREESGSEIVLTTTADKQERIPRDEIDALRPGTVSVMPQGLDQQLSSQELADVVAFLQSCR
ncbi:MAG: PVC-type heme-binding CxxCH protein [Pirellulales bacterium]